MSKSLETFWALVACSCTESKLRFSWRNASCLEDPQPELPNFLHNPAAWNKKRSVSWIQFCVNPYPIPQTTQFALLQFNFFWSVCTESWSLINAIFVTDWIFFEPDMLNSNTKFLQQDEISSKPWILSIWPLAKGSPWLKCNVHNCGLFCSWTRASCHPSLQSKRPKLTVENLARGRPRNLVNL